MGIDVWTLRGNDSGGDQAEVSPAAADPPGEVAPKTQPSGEATAVLNQIAVPNQITQPSEPATAVQRQVAEALAGTAVEAGEEAVAKPTTRQERPAQPRFTLAFLHYDQLGLCLCLPDGQAKVPRLFCDDIARALGNDPETARFQLLEWPMLKHSSSIDQSIDAAIQVVAQKFSLLPGTVLVFGEAAKQYHPGLETLVVAGGVQELAGQTVYLFDEVSQVMQSAATKRTLWQTLRQASTVSKAG